MANDNTLRLPAIRAHMGDWMYYVTFLTMNQIAEHVRFAEDIHSNESLRDLLQRRLTKRSGNITQYLLNQDQRFFNALVVASYGGAPKWQEISLRKRRGRTGDDQEDSHLEGLLGVLILDGSEKLFALDGQHRVAGIRAAIQKRKALGDEEVCVLLVRGVTQRFRSEDEAGFERTRRLFTTLNRYAKPVSKRDIIALDEDDVVAILTRNFVDEYALFKDKVSSKTVNSIHRSDTTSFTTITAIYDSLEFFLKDRRDWKAFRRFRPSDEGVESYGRTATELWESLRRNFAVIEEMYASDPADRVAARYRGLDGGHLLFRPVGLLVVARAIRRLMDQGADLQGATERLARLPMMLAEEPWQGILWNPVNRRMIISGETKGAAERLLVYLAGGDLEPLKATKESLRRDLRGLRTDPDYHLPEPQM